MDWCLHNTKTLFPSHFPCNFLNVNSFLVDQCKDSLSIFNYTTLSCRSPWIVTANRSFLSHLFNRHLYYRSANVLHRGNYSSFRWDSLRARLSKLKSIRNLKPEAITILLINSFTKPTHEHQAASFARSESPDLSVSLSSDVLPETMEYKRTVTTVANSYVKPVIGRYLVSVEERLKDIDVKVLRSDDELSTASVAKENCASLLHSVSGVAFCEFLYWVLQGPAGGVSRIVNQVARATKYKVWNTPTFSVEFQVRIY